MLSKRSNKIPKVLLVEDEAILSGGLKITLDSAGFESILASDAQEALDKLDQHRVDVILLDMFLPDGNGMQLLHEIRSHDDTLKIPILLCTTAAKNIEVRSMYKYGVSKILDKTTITSEQLVDLLYMELSK